MAELTPSQTVGPFFAYCLTPEAYTLTPVFSGDLVVPGLAGGFGHAVGAGPRSNTGFRGFGRSGTDKDGRFAFRTVKPGRVNDANGTLQAPHLDVTVLARGMLKQVTTRIYFGDEAANGSDPVLALVPADRRETLIATPTGNGAGEARYAFDIRLQEGEDGVPETVFFDV